MKEFFVYFWNNIDQWYIWVERGGGFGLSHIVISTFKNCPSKKIIIIIHPFGRDIMQLNVLHCVKYCLLTFCRKILQKFISIRFCENLNVPNINICQVVRSSFNFQNRQLIYAMFSVCHFLRIYDWSCVIIRLWKMIGRMSNRRRIFRFWNFWLEIYRVKRGWGLGRFHSFRLYTQNLHIKCKRGILVNHNIIHTIIGT